MIKTCAICGREFVPKSSLGKYCSSECYHAGNLQKQTELRAQNRTRKLKKGHMGDGNKRLAAKNAGYRDANLSYGHGVAADHPEWCRVEIPAWATVRVTRDGANKV